MANSLVVTLLLKTGAFSNDIKKAGSQVKQFQQGCSTAGKSLDAFGKAIGIDVGMLTKFGGAVGIAVAAGKGLKAVIDSNQTSADAFQAVMYSAKTAVNELAYAIGTFDFSNFQDGLSGIIKRAREAAIEIDQLGDTLRGYSVLEAEAAAAVAHARKVGRDKNATKEEKEAANAAARAAVEAARDGAKEAADQYVAVLGATLRSKGAQVTNDEVFGLVKNAIVLNAQAGREAGKALGEAQYNAYLNELNELQRNHTITITTQSITGSSTISKLDEDNEDYKRGLQELAEKYKEGIVLHDVLIKQTDEELDKTTSMLTSVYRLNEMVDTMDSRLEGIENKTNGTTTSTQKAAEAINGSLADWQKIAQESQKNRDASVYMSDAWKEANNQLEEALENIEKITAAMERAKTESKYGTDILTPITGPNLTGQVENTKPDRLAGVNKHTIEDLEAMVAVYEKLNKKLTDSDPLLAHYNQRIKELRQEIERLKQYGVWTPPVPTDEDSEKWDKFTNAMYRSADAVSSISETFQSGMKVTAASVMKMISQTLPAINSLIDAYVVLAGVEATSKAVTTSKHWIEAIAAVAALGAAVAAALSMAKSNKSKFANGGIVGGNSFTGDRVTAQVNSGEMILNKAQQARLFKLANGSAVGGQQVEFHISGTELVGVLNNQNRKNRLIQ